MKTLLILILLMNLLRTGSCTETRDQVLSITPKTEEQVEMLKNVSSHYETALWQPESPEYIRQEAEVRLFVPAESSETVKNLLQTHDVTHEVLLENVEELVKLQKSSFEHERGFTDFYQMYHNLTDIYKWINRTHQENPNTTEVFSIGSSTENRPLYVLKLSLNNKPDKKSMWIDCGIHAREWISPAFCLWFVHHSLTSYGNNADITLILDNMDVYVLPVLNPDGYEYTWTTSQNRMWRKNRSFSNNTSCSGVDLNRNFNSSWCTTGASHDPCSDTYCGSAPESEPESRAVADFLRQHKDSVQLYLSMHAYSQLLLFPYCYTYNETENHEDLLEMAGEAAQKIQNNFNNTYEYGPGAKTIYLATGGSYDWAFDLGIKYSFTFELQDRGRYGFMLPPSRIPAACGEALTAVKTIALKVIEKTKDQATATPPAAELPVTPA